MNKKDITDKNDIELLVNSFYKEVRSDKILNFIFEDIAKVDWESHLPKMYSFWASLLLGEHSYEGDPMTTHVALSKKVQLNDIQFSTWVSLFNRTVDSNFYGEKATEAKLRAANIARIMQYKIQTS